MPYLAVLYTTVSSLEDAKKLARTVLLEKKAVCVNIIPRATSLYLFEGEIKEEREYLMVFKTDREHLSRLEKVISQEHPYRVPCILIGEPRTSVRFYRYLRTQLRKVFSQMAF